MAGEIDISRLSGTQQVIAKTADLDKNGKIDNALEKSIYNDFAVDAGLDPDMGLVVESGVSIDKQVKQAKQDEKDAQKIYKKLFAKDAGTVRNADDAANDRVADLIKKCKGEVATKMEEAIATRPSPLKFAAKGPQYMQELEAWVDRVNHAFDESIIDHMDENDFELGQKIDNAEGAVYHTAGQVVSTVVAATEVLADEIQEGNAQIADAVAQEGAATRGAVHAEGAATRKTVHAEGAATRATVHQEGAATRAAVHQEGAATRATVHFEGAVTRRAVHQEGAATRNVVRQEGAATRAEVVYQGETTRATVRDQAQATQIANSQREALATNFNTSIHDATTRNRFNAMADQIEQSNLGDAAKQELRANLVALSQETFIEDYKINDMEAKIRTATSSDGVVYNGADADDIGDKIQRKLDTPGVVPGAVTGAVVGKATLGLAGTIPGAVIGAEIGEKIAEKRE